MIRREPIDQRDLHLARRPRDLFLAHAFLGDLPDLGHERLLDGLEGDTRSYAGGRVEHAGVGHFPVAAVGVERELLVVDQRAVEPARTTAGQDLTRHVEGLAVVVSGRGCVPAGEEQRKVRLVVHVGASLAALLDDRRRVARNHRRARQTPERALDLREGRRGLEVPDDHEGQVVGGIVGVEESATGVHAHLLDVGPPSDHGPAIGMGLPDQRGESLEATAVGGVLGPQAALFQDDLALAREALLVDDEVEEALGLKVDHEGQRLRGHIFVVDGDVAARVGVDPAAALVDELGVDFLPDILRSTKHHVLE